jgi:hypothetical protein
MITPARGIGSRRRRRQTTTRRAQLRSAWYLREGANALTPAVANRPRRKALENFMVVAVDERREVVGEGERVCVRVNEARD